MTMYNTKKKHFDYVDGYYSTTAYPQTYAKGQEVIGVRDLPGHESSHCWVLITKDYVILQSYNTIVSIWNKNAKKMDSEEKYSRTTSNQQSWFRSFINKEFA